MAWTGPGLGRFAFERGLHDPAVHRERGAQEPGGDTLDLPRCIAEHVRL